MTVCRTDLCAGRSFLQEAGTRLSAQVMSLETWLGAVQLAFWIKKKKKSVLVRVIFKNQNSTQVLLLHIRSGKNHKHHRRQPNILLVLCAVCLL